MMTQTVSMQSHLRRAVLLTVLLLVSAAGASAQSATFTYQGRLQDSGTAANGNYDLQFTLWDALNGGTQQPQPSPVTVARGSVAVANGSFTVQLDFPASAFPGADRFLEIGVRLAGFGPFSTLLPRQPITSTPYAIRSASSAAADTATTATNAATATNATQLDGVAAAQYVRTSDSRMTDARAPTAGSSNYIQNNPASTQTSSSFNISGNGTAGGTLTANALNATTSVGIGTTPTRARLETRGAIGNTVALFGGEGAGVSLTRDYPFIGFNSYYNLGWKAISPGYGGHLGIEGSDGAMTFYVNPSVSSAAVSSVEEMRITQSGNVGIGTTAPVSQLHVKGASGATSVRILGDPATLTERESVDFMAFSSQFSSDLGGMRIQRQSSLDPNVNGNIDTIFLAAPNGNPATEKMRVAGNGNVGIGTTTTLSSNHRLEVQGGSSIGVFGQSSSEVGVFGRSETSTGVLGISTSGFGVYGTTNSGYAGFFSGRVAVQDGNLTVLDKVGIGTTVPSNKLSVNGGADFSGNVGIGTTNPSNKLSVSGNADFSGNVAVNGRFLVNTLESGGTSLCILGGYIASCSSSLRYKKDLLPFNAGLSILNRLRPITFTWKSRPERDLGLGAEDVAAVEPLLTFRNAKGEIEGVKYDRLTVVLINSIKEQQAQIEAQQKLLDDQRGLLTQQQDQISQQQKTIARQSSRLKQQLSQSTLQQTQIDGLKKVVCRKRSKVGICKQ